MIHFATSLVQKINRRLSNALVTFCLLIVSIFIAPVFAYEQNDATIHDCIAATTDRWWALGERGQMLLSEDAGRSWNPAAIDGTPNLYAGIAIDERRGVAVGGNVHAYSHRSVGVIQVTNDGGRRWRAIESHGLPRLTGIQKLSSEHWIVWGDWSPDFQSAIFETQDGGSTWTPKTLAASHVQTTAWKDSENGVVVDRLGRVFRFEKGQTPRQLSLGGDASNPILKVCHHESGWWLIGESAQIYHSHDGNRWQAKSLPGNATDHALIRLNDIAFQASDGTSNSRCWVVGSPGSVVWSSDDLGSSWQTQLTSQSMPLNCIAQSGNETLFAGGRLATIIGTRNSGEGWWILGRQGERMALLSVAAVQGSIPWDALSVTANESRGHAASIVLHSERTYERAGPWCDSATRAGILAVELGIASLETLVRSPVGSLPSNRAAIDLSAYPSKFQAIGDESLERKAVFLIRQNRPDVLVSDAFDSRDPLCQVAGRMVMTARNRASDPRFICFSSESGIPDYAWDCKTLLARSPLDASAHQRRSELRLAATTPIHREGKLLSETLVAVGATVSEANSMDPMTVTYGVTKESFPPWDQYGNYATVFGLRPAGGKTGLLPEGIRHSGSMRSKSTKNSVSQQTLISNLQRESMLKSVLELDVDETTRDFRWRSTLQQFLNATSSETRSHSLWYLAQEARRKGQWNRWSLCLDLLLGEYSKEGAAEMAAIQQSAWKGSREVQHWRQQQSMANTSSNQKSDVTTAHFTGKATSSPFDLRIESKTVARSSDKQTTMGRNPSRSTIQSQPASRIVSPVENASSKVVNTNKSLSNNAGAIVPSNDSSTGSIAVTNIESDPRFLLLNLRQTANIQNSLEKMTHWDGLYEWSTLANEEYLIRIAMQSPSSSSNTIRIPTSKARPILDGSLDDAVWKNAYQQRLTYVAMDPIQDGNPTNTSTIFWVRDNRFLYIAGICETLSSQNSNQPKVKMGNSSERTGRLHDEPRLGVDQITLRFDTDRDFLTWFQLTIDSDGNLTDSLNDLDAWNPRWYAETARNETGWRFELAIPLSELSDEDWMNNSSVLWNVAAKREVPGAEITGVPVQQSKKSLSEELSPVSWLPVMIR